MALSGRGTGEVHSTTGSPAAAAGGLSRAAVAGQWVSLSARESDQGYIGSGAWLFQRAMAASALGLMAFCT